MRQVKKLGRAAAMAALVVGAALASRAAAAQEPIPEPPNPGGQNDQSDQSDQSQARPQANGTRPPADEPAVVAAQQIDATFKVQAIDKKERTLTLKDPSGGVLDVKAGPNVDLDKLHKGQALDVSYFAEVALAVGKAGEGAPGATAQAAEHAGVTAKQATVTARITSIDREHDTVVVRGPAGRIHTLRIDDPALRAQLAQIKPGDDLSVTYTQAVAVSAQPSEHAQPKTRSTSRKKAAPTK